MRAFLAGLGVIFVAVALVATTGASENRAPYRAQAWSNPDTPTREDALAAVRWVSETQARTVWLYGVEAQRLADAQRRDVVVRGSASYLGVGECTGFSVPDYIIQRESGGNPEAHNPSGAHGCTQTLLSHYSSGQCQGLDPYTVDGQRECTYRLSNGGTNLAPWNETR